MNEKVNLSRIANLTFNFLKKYSGKDNICQIGYNKLAKKLKISRTSAILGIRELILVNMIKKLSPPSPNPDNLSNEYEVMKMPPPPLNNLPNAYTII
ncbi:MAG: hypothetical protein KAG43_04470 [Candidatus Marithrix sp.]|nr:hypothetical protein [Candidatus Marithrix sp.]